MAFSVTVVSNGGSGFADNVAVEPTTNVGQLVRDTLEEGSDSNDFTIRLNGDIVSEGQLLQPGDKLVIAPTKMQGA